MHDKNNQPLISIITVVYNGEKYFEQTIQSVINQTYKNIEYIIIDGGSTDGTLDIIKKYEKNISYWVSEKDNGLYDAMNKGISVAKGELIGMINSDDWYNLDTIDIIVNAYLKNSEKRIFHGDTTYINEDGGTFLRKFNPSVFKFKYYGSTHSHPTFFVSKSEYKEHKYNTKLKSLSDYQFTLEAYLKDKNKFHHTDKALANFRTGGISSALSLSKTLKEGYISRKIAGLSLFERIFYILFRSSTYLILKSIKMKEKK